MIDVSFFFQLSVRVLKQPKAMAGGMYALPPCGVPMLMDEVAKEAREGASVRVVGRYASVCCLSIFQACQIFA